MLRGITPEVGYRKDFITKLNYRPSKIELYKQQRIKPIVLSVKNRFQFHARKLILLDRDYGALLF